MKEVTIKVVAARGLAREVVLHTTIPPQEDESAFPHEEHLKVLILGVHLHLKVVE